MTLDALIQVLAVAALLFFCCVSGTLLALFVAYRVEREHTAQPKLDSEQVAEQHLYHIERERMYAD